MVPGIVRMTRLKLRQRAGWAKARACALCPRLSRGHTSRDNGGHASLCPPYGAGALAAVVIAVAATAPTAAFAQTPGPPTDAEILALMRTHCVACHAAEPTHPAFAKAPAGVLLETVPQIVANAARIRTQVVDTRAMPLGNETGMTDEERDRIAAWVEGRNK